MVDDGFKGIFSKVITGDKGLYSSFSIFFGEIFGRGRFFTSRK
jgi:hypothetical protein